ncbi:YfhL family 4Fe-4S dicluster ferredoxin [Streptomyces sp. NPDC058576]|uniref:YfhL family 4Fe-4S dicluster ferredoxin n=1 Tax=Streptomyces sp. NPDC058576 TaxID=3346547 RepID=UPI00365E43F1
MAITITEDCINCGACEPECPTKAITEGDDIYVINPSACSECVGFSDSLACQAVCPPECCLPDPGRVETEDVLIRRSLSLRPDSDELRRKAAANDYPSHFRK